MTEPKDTSDEWARKNLDYAIAYSVEALKTALLLNGGAAVGLLSLVSALSSKDNSKIAIVVPMVKIAISSFGYGVACVAVSFGSAYLAQLAFLAHCKNMSKTSLVWANILRVIGLITFLGSIFFFYRGVTGSMEAISPNVTGP